MTEVSRFQLNAGTVAVLVQETTQDVVVIPGLIGATGATGPRGEDSGGELYVEVISSELADGDNVTFPLTNVAKYPFNLQVSRNGLSEVYGIGFSCTATYVTFTTAPLSSDVVVLSYQI